MRRPASRETISDSVELCEQKFVSHTSQLIGKNVWLPNMHKIPPEVDFESSRSRAKSQSWNSPSLRCCAVFPTWQCCFDSLVWWISDIKRAKRLSQALVHLVTARASLFTDHRMSGLPMRAKYKHFLTTWEHIFDNSPTDPNSSSSNWWSSRHGVVTLYSCWVWFRSPARNIAPHISLRVLPYHRTMRKCLRQVSQSRAAFSVTPAEILNSNIFL